MLNKVKFQDEIANASSTKKWSFEDWDEEPLETPIVDSCYRLGKPEIDVKACGSNESFTQLTDISVKKRTYSQKLFHLDSDDDRKTKILSSKSARNLSLMWQDI